MGDFPNIFRKIREQSGLTQQQMADKLGVSRSAIGMYEMVKENRILKLWN